MKASRGSSSVRPRTKSVTRARGAVALVALFSALCACDVFRDSSTEAVAECTDYASLVRRCFGDRIGASVATSFAVPPKDGAGREALRARCSAQAARLERNCR